MKPYKSAVLLLLSQGLLLSHDASAFVTPNRIISSRTRIGSIPPLGYMLPNVNNLFGSRPNPNTNTNNKMDSQTKTTKPFFLEKVSMEEERVKILLEELEELRAKLYKEQVSSYQVKIKQVTMEEQGLLFQLQDMALEHEELLSKLDTTTCDFQRLNVEYDALQVELTTKTKLLASQRQSASLESNELSNQVMKLEENVRTMQTEVSSLNDILVGMQVVLSEKENELNEMKQTSKKDLMASTMEKNRLIQQKRELESKLQEERMISLERQTSLQTAHQEQTKLSSQLTSVQSQYTKLTSSSQDAHAKLQALLDETEEELAASKDNAERQVSAYMEEKAKLLREKQVVEDFLAKQTQWLADATKVKDDKQAQWKEERGGLMDENQRLTLTLQTVRTESATAMQELLKEKNEEMALVQQRAEEELAKWVKGKQILLQEKQDIQDQLERVSKELESSTITSQTTTEAVKPPPPPPSSPSVQQLTRKTKGFGKQANASKSKEVTKLRHEKRDLYLQLETLQKESAQAMETLVQEKELEVQEFELEMEKELTALMQEKEQLELEKKELETELASKDFDLSQTQDLEQRFNQQEADWDQKEQALNEDKKDLVAQIESVRTEGTQAIEKLLNEKKYEISNFKQDAKTKLTQLALEKEDIAKEKEVLELELETQKQELTKLQETLNQETLKQEEESLWKKAAENMKDEKIALIDKIEFIQKETAEVLEKLSQEKDEEIAIYMEAAEMAFAKQIREVQDKQEEQETLGKKAIELLLKEKEDLVKKLDEMESNMESASSLNEEDFKATLQEKDDEIAKAKETADNMFATWNEERQQLEDEKAEIKMLLEKEIKVVKQPATQENLDIESMKKDFAQEAEEKLSMELSKWVLEKKQLESEKAKIQTQLDEQKSLIQDVMTTRDRERLEWQQTMQNLTNEKIALSDKVKMMEQEISKLTSSGKKAMQMLMQQKDEQIAKIKSEAESYFEQWGQERKKMEKDKVHLVSQIQTMEKNSIAEITQLRNQAGQEIEALKRNLAASFQSRPGTPDERKIVEGTRPDQEIDTLRAVKESTKTIQMDSNSVENARNKKERDHRRSRTLSFNTYNGMVKHDKHF